MQNIVIGALASVDAGKTTLSEILLYKTGTIRKLGRVDHNDAFLDFNRLEKEKGITIFNKEARFNYKNREYIYIDTPGHRELENQRNASLKILDVALLIIDANFRSLNNEIELYRKIMQNNIPCIIFINKIDIAHFSKDEILARLKKEIDANCASTKQIDDLLQEEIIGNIGDSICKHDIIPVLFGSALKDENIDELLEYFTYIEAKEESEILNAYIYRKDDTFSYLKILSGQLNNKTSFDLNNKVNEMYKINGNSYTPIQIAYQGDVVAIKGLKDYGVGTYLPSLFNDLSFNLEQEKIINVDGNHYAIFNKVKVLNDNMPELNIRLIKDDIYINIEGQLKEEIIIKLFKEKFNLDISFLYPAIEEEIIIDEQEDIKEDSPYVYKRESISDEELKRVFNSIYKPKERVINKKTQEDKKEEYVKTKDLLYIIDGYNLLHALDDYKDEDFSILRDKVINIVCDFKGYVNAQCMLVFDAYKTQELKSRVINHDNITIVYTKNKQTADEYIEIKTKELKDEYRIIVVTSDYLEQIRVFSNGANRLSSRGFLERYESFKKDKIKPTSTFVNRPLSDLRKLLEDD